jgi:flagellar basal body-associated protein FliL
MSCRNNHKKAQMSNISKLIIVLIVVAIIGMLIYKFVLGLGKTAVNVTTVQDVMQMAVPFSVIGSYINYLMKHR